MGSARHGRQQARWRRRSIRRQRPRGQSEYAYTRLKDAIMTGVSIPHRRLVEAEVTQALGVSRTTLRAALIRYQFGSILVPGRRDQSLAEHQAILAALEAQDAVEIERPARLHMANVREMVEKNGAHLT